MVSVHVARPKKVSKIPVNVSHNADILFTFVLQGSFKLTSDKEIKVEKGDAFVIPPKTNYKIENYSPDLELLEVALPGDFEVIQH
jgi:mannose-6-phosphate isomerase-like protein (cupin superfamily)